MLPGSHSIVGDGRDHSRGSAKASRAAPRKGIIVIWDNVRYHHSRLVRVEAAQLGIELRFLPPYSPDLIPVERLWSWLRRS